MSNLLLLVGALGVALVVIVAQHAKLKIWKGRALQAEERAERARVQRNRMTDALWKVIEERLRGAQGQGSPFLKDPDWWKRE